MKSAKPSGLKAQIYAEASDWFVDFRVGDVDPATCRNFNAWLRKSPENVRAYVEIAAIWNEGASLDARRRFSVEDLIARAKADSVNVVPLEIAEHLGREASRVADAEPLRQRAEDAALRHAVRSKRVRLVAAAAMICVAVMFAWYQVGHDPTYATDVGEQRSLALADGSTVELNSRSRIRLRFTPEQRTVELVEGQALFHVAKDAARPFVVDSNGVRVRAVGTQFDVYRRKTATTVTVVEGRVAVLENTSDAADAPDSTAGPRLHPQSPPGVLLSAGEQLIVTPHAQNAPTRANIAAATAWTQRRIVFESASLADAAEEFNRYNTRQIVVRGIAPEFRINGVFSSTDPTSLVRFLRARTNFNIHETDRQIEITGE
jgi:transmembrane sensor